jgi:hypothetical protein
MPGPKAPSAIHGPLGPIFYPIDKANIIGDTLGSQFRAHDLCDCDHRRHMGAQVEALLATVDEDIPVNFRPCDVSKEIQSLKLGNARGLYGIPNECLRHRRGRIYSLFKSGRLSTNIKLTLCKKHNISLKIAVQGPDYYGPPLIYS